MTSNEEVEAFFQHVGVKGMRWGVRKTKSSTPKDNTERNRKIKKVAAATAIGAAVGIGFVLATKKHNMKQLSKLPSFKNTINSGKKSTETILNNSGKMKSSFVPKSTPKPSSQHAKIMKDIASNQIRIIKDANNDLRSWHNEHGTPMTKREYLETGYWDKIVG